MTRQLLVSAAFDPYAAEKTTVVVVPEGLDVVPPCQCASAAENKGGELSYPWSDRPSVSKIATRLLDSLSKM